MIRDEVEDKIHSYASWSSEVMEDGIRSIGESTRQTYLRKYQQGLTDLMRKDGLVPGDQITSEVYFRYMHMKLWPEDELLRNPDPRIQREIEYDIARRGNKKARDDYWAKWQDIDLPGDVVIR